MALNNKPVFKDAKTRKKIDLHLSDINDEISENDIASIKTDVTPTSTETDMVADAEATALFKKKQAEDKANDENDEDGNNTNSVDSSWDVLK